MGSEMCIRDRLLINYKHPINVRDRWNSTPSDEAKREKRVLVYNFLKALKAKNKS